MKRLFFYITAATVLVACKKDEKPQNKQLSYMQSYYLSWTLDDKTTYISGKLGSSENDYRHLSADDKSVIAINGLKFIPSKNVNPVERVGTSFFGLLGADFILYKSDGSEIKNKVNPNEVSYADFPSDFPTVISKSKNFSFEWVGQLPIANGEYVLVSVITSNPPPQDSTKPLPITRVFKEGVYNSHKIEIPQSEIAKLPEGDAVVEIARSGQYKELANRDNNVSAHVYMATGTTRKVIIVK